MDETNNIYLYKDKKNPNVRGTVYHSASTSYCPWRAIITDEYGVKRFSDSYQTLRGAQTQLGRHTTNGMKRIKVIKGV